MIPVPGDHLALINTSGVDVWQGDLKKIPRSARCYAEGLVLRSDRLF